MPPYIRVVCLPQRANFRVPFYGRLAFADENQPLIKAFLRHRQHGLNRLANIFCAFGIPDLVNRLPQIGIAATNQDGVCFDRNVAGQTVASSATQFQNGTSWQSLHNVGYARAT